VDTTKLRTDVIMRNFYENFLKSDFLKRKNDFFQITSAEIITTIELFQNIFFERIKKT